MNRLPNMTIMKKISRDFADKLIRNSDPVQSKIAPGPDQLCVIFDLSNGISLWVIYNYNDLQKNYFIGETHPDISPLADT
jgi:hypothetical protein